MIQAMTIGSDVSSLFPDVVNGMQTNHIELKKLVYLYVMKYGKAQPDLATFAIHFFKKEVRRPWQRQFVLRSSSIQIPS